VSEHALRRAMVIQALSNAGTSSAGLFIPLLAHEVGASDLQLGVIGAVFGATLFVSAWSFGRWADMGRRRAIIRAGLLAAALAAPVHMFATDPASLALARGLFGFAAGIYPAALIAYAYDAQRKPGRFAAWGGLGWGLGTLGAGLLGSHREVFAFAALCLVAAFLLALRMEPRPQARMHVPWFPREVIRNNFPAYLAVLTRNVGASAVWIVFPLYLVGLGASPLIIGLVYFLNTGSQFFFMRVLDRFPAGQLVTGGLVTSSLVFVLFWAAPTWELILPVQLLLSLSWSLLYVGALAWVMEHNVERATSTGLLQSTLSLSNILGPLLGGAVAWQWGYGATMLVAAAFSLLGVPLFLSSARRLERAAKQRAAEDVVLLGALAKDAEAPPREP
jgi:MFS family permease